MSTSKPRSANAVATTLAPRSWPSWPELGDHHARAAALLLGERRDLGLELLPALGASRRRLHTRRSPFACRRGGARRPSRAHRRPRPRWRAARIAWMPGRAGCPRRCRAAAVSASSAALHARRVARRARSAARRVICCSRTATLSISRISIAVFLGQPVLVDADDHVLAGVDARLLLRRRRLDLELGPARLDGAGHAAHRLDFLDDRPRRVGHVLRQPSPSCSCRPTGRSRW